ncbi:MAG: DUF2231 domain-containing protein [Isosphaeraceae bacterium]|nr:DUF2231 domain-containing protein [Isosphaeraceae bacterium]
MDPITATIQKTEEALGHSPHPAIVMLPLGAWATSNICDILGLLTGDRRYDDAARISMAIGLVGAAGAVLTGVRDYGYIPPDRQPNHDVATTHGLGNAVVGTLMVSSYLLREHDHEVGRRPGLLARLLALTGGSLALYTAWLGGKLVEEYGEAVHPVMERWQEQEEQGEHETEPHGDAHGRERLSPESPLGLHRE